jgi:hypothetical protein
MAAVQPERWVRALITNNQHLTVHKLCIILFFVDVCFVMVVRNYCRHVQIVVQVCSLW